MAAWQDPGFEPRNRRVGRKNDGGVVLEDDTRARPALILQRATEDAGPMFLPEAACALQLVVQTGRLDADRVELRVWVLERGTRRTTMVVEDHDMLERFVARVMLVAGDV